jgi:hypothetical protein
MLNTRSALAVILSLSFASPSSACFKWPWPSVIAWTISAAGAGIGAMSIVSQIRSNNDYAASFSPSKRVVTGYLPLEQQCPVCFNRAASSCTWYPWGATYLASFKVPVGNATQIYNTTGLSMMYADITGTLYCGKSKDQAIAAIAADVAVGSSKDIWYQNDNPSSWTFYVINPASGWEAGIAASAAVFAIAGAVGGFLFCLTAPPKNQYVTQAEY